MSKRKPRRRTIADQLRKAVRDSGKTVNAIASDSGIPQPVLFRFVSGERDLTLATGEKLARYFDLELRKRDD